MTLSSTVCLVAAFAALTVGEVPPMERAKGVATNANALIGFALGHHRRAWKAAPCGGGGGGDVEATAPPAAGVSAEGGGASGALGGEGEPASGGGGQLGGDSGGKGGGLGKQLRHPSSPPQ